MEEKRKVAKIKIAWLKSLFLNNYVSNREYAHLYTKYWISIKVCQELNHKEISINIKKLPAQTPVSLTTMELSHNGMENKHQIIIYKTNYSNSDTISNIWHLKTESNQFMG